MLIRTLSRVICHFSGAWLSSPSSFSMSCGQDRRRRHTRTHDRKNKSGLQRRSGKQTSHSQELGDGVGLGAAHTAVTRPHDPSLAVRHGVRLLCAVHPGRHHPPVVTRPRGQSLVCEEVPFVEAGNADGGLQDHLQTQAVSEGRTSSYSSKTQ